MRLLFTLLFIPFLSFAQEEAKHTLTIREIDCIAENQDSPFGLLSLVPDHDSKTKLFGGIIKSTYDENSNGILRKSIDMHFIEEKWLSYHHITESSIFYYNEGQPYYGIVKIIRTRRNGKLISEKEYHFTIKNKTITDTLPSLIKEIAESAYSFLNK